MPWPIRFGPPPRMTTFFFEGTGLAFDLAHDGGLVGGIHVGRLRLELGRAGVDALEDGRDAEVLARAADLVLVAAGKPGEAGVGEAHHLEAAEAGFAHRQAVPAEVGLDLHDLADAGEEPAVEGGGGGDLVVGQPVAHRLRDDPEPVGRAGRERAGDGGGIGGAVDGDLVEAGEARFQRGERLLERFVEGAADGHRLAHRFHRGGEFGLGAWELLEGEAGDLGHDIVDGGLEGGGRHAW
jgi:hypothetical protein